jgi:multimeric flavodoxin WrbA
MTDPLTTTPNSSVPQYALEDEEEALAADEATTTSALAGSATLGSANFDPRSMTSDALILYLSTRLGNVDTQMKSILDRENAAQKVRGELSAIQQLLTTLPEKTDAQELIAMTPEVHERFMAEMNGHLDTIEVTDKDLADKLRAHLGSDGQILCGASDDLYNTAELDASKDYLGMVSKDIESGSQMDMINLQSLMGARQTAIQLATNLVNALSESQKSIVSNIR